MDRKSIIVVALCFILIIAWQPLIMPRLRPPVPVPVSANQAANVTANTPAGATNAAVAPSAGTNAPVPAGTAVTPAKFVVRPEIPEQLLVVTNENGRYIFTSRGGGLKEVELTGYAEAVSSHRKKNRETNEFATLNSPAVPPVFAMVGDESLQGDGVFKLTQTANGVRAEKSLPNGLTVVKDFQLSTNFIVVASLKLENRSQQPVTIPSYQWVAGTATPMGPQDTGLAESVLWFNGSKAETVSLQYFNTNTSSWFGLRSRVPETEYLAGSNNVYWSSAQNQFFTLAAMPDKPASAIVVHMVDLPPPTPEELKDYPNARRDPKGLEAGLVYPAAELKPGATLTNQFNLFAGPKEYQTLARLASRFNNEIDQVMGFGWSGPISKALLVTMNWFHMALGLPYGWVIIIITLLIKLVFWPLTQASTRSAKRMQALQPQLKALQEKYKDEPQKFTAKQWEFYKKNKVNPLSGCLPMLIQIPVFIGFYGMLRTAIELRGAPFLWIGDLSKPDTVFSLFLPFHFLGFSDAFFPINPMPLIMGITLLVQGQLAPMSPSMDPGQQKMMKYMPLMMLLFMYNLSSGLALYWTVNNMLTIVQTKLTRMQKDPVLTETAKPTTPTPPQKKKK